MKSLFLFLVLLPTWVFGQKSAQQLNKRLKSDLIIEKATVVLHQPTYIPGDSVFCSIAYLSSQPIKQRKIVSLELWNSKNEIFFQQYVLLKSGLANGGFLIPSDAAPGIYSMVIRTIGNDMLYQNDFVIHSNTLLGGLKIYPEGGNFIYDINNAAVLKYSPELATGFFKIRKSDGTNILSAALDSTGYLKFQFEPKSSEKYIAEVHKNGANYTIHLPSTKEEGVAMQLIRDNESTSCKIKVRGLRAVQLQILLCNQNGIAFSSPVKIEDRECTVIFPKNLTGDFQAVVVDELWNDLAKQWVSLRGTVPPADASDLQLGKTQYNTRELVELKVQLPTNARHAALRVVKKDLFGTEKLVSYSEQIDPDFRNLVLAARENDLLSWNKVKPGDMIKPKPDSYVTISGRAFNAGTGLPVTDSTLLMFFFQSQVMGYEVTALKDGRFTLSMVYDLYKSERVFYTASKKGRDEWNIKIEFETSVPSFTSQQPSTTTSGSDNLYSIYMNNKRVIDDSYRYVNSNISDKKMRPNEKFEEELGGVDVSVRLADYISFSSMSEIAREILPALEHRKINGKDVVRVYTTHKRPANLAGPLFIIDGEMTKDPSFFMNLKPEEVISIKIVKDNLKLRNMGAIADNGVVLVETKTVGKFKSFGNSFSLNGLMYDGRTKYFDSPIHSSNRIPDLRPCLLWVPNVKTSEGISTSFSFLTSDDIGEYWIQLFCTDDNGIQTYSTSSIWVVPGGLKP